MGSVILHLRVLFLCMLVLYGFNINIIINTINTIIRFLKRADARLRVLRFIQVRKFDHIMPIIISAPIEQSGTAQMLQVTVRMIRTEVKDLRQVGFKFERVGVLKIVLPSHRKEPQEAAQERRGEAVVVQQIS